jgi:leucyl aminopeptidase
MLSCFSTEKNTALPVTLVKQQDFAKWQETQSLALKAWLAATQFCAEAGHTRLIPDHGGKISRVLCCLSNKENLWDVSGLPFLLPEGVYAFDSVYGDHHAYAVAWGLGAYQFTRYKKPTRTPAQLYLSPDCLTSVLNTVESIYLVRDWINTPADDMGPSELAAVANTLAEQYDARFSQIVDKALLQQNYTSIYTVGRASDDAPRLLEMRWGQAKYPLITLVGKGVCFDSGGLDIKSSAGMILMKKDMAGAAHVLGLARMIMQAKLPVYLRVLIPVVENVVSGNAYHPGDVIKSRKGLTIEIGNTDAEGRVILADVLTEAVSEQPSLLIDITTLTGAARIALGTELPAVFSNHDTVVNDVLSHGQQQCDPMWRLPLFASYRESMNSQVADINNVSADAYGGAIIAGLFLQTFVPDDIPWLHFDLMAWNTCARPGRPLGGEAMTLRALFSYIQARYTA